MGPFQTKLLHDFCGSLGKTNRGIVSNTKTKALKVVFSKGDRTQRICPTFKLPPMYRLLPHWKTDILIKILKVFSELSDVISEHS